MKHDKPSNFVLAALVLSSVCVIGCRSSRSTVEKSEATQTALLLKSDSAGCEGIRDDVSACEKDSVGIQFAAVADIFVQRDSVGRIERITCKAETKLNKTAENTRTQRAAIQRESSSRSAEASGAVVAVSQKTAQATAEVDAGIPLKGFVGFGLSVFGIFYVWFLWKSRK